MALNFQDVPIQLRPLFEDLDRQLTRAEDRRQLRDVAQEVATRQAFRLTVGGGYNSGPLTVKTGDVLEIPELLATVTIESVGKDSFRAHIDSKLPRPAGSDRSTWDTSSGRSRTIRSSASCACASCCWTPSGGQATIRVIAFSSELAADRFDIKELSRSLRDKQ